MYVFGVPVFFTYGAPGPFPAGAPVATQTHFQGHGPGRLVTHNHLQTQNLSTRRQNNRLERGALGASYGTQLTVSSTGQPTGPAFTRTADQASSRRSVNRFRRTTTQAAVLDGTSTAADSDTLPKVAEDTTHEAEQAPSTTSGSPHASHLDQQHQQQQQDDESKPWFRNGDTVMGKVVWSNDKGAKVELLDDPRVIGYMPVKEGPFGVRGVYEENKWAFGAVKGPCLPKGFTRTFRVLRTNSETAYSGRGPLLSARHEDLDLLWKRAYQLLEASMHDKENFRVTVAEVNGGGLLSRLEGLQIFIPISHLPRANGSDWWTEEDLQEQYVNKELEIAVTEVDRLRKKVVASVLVANENRALRQIEVGGLVWGTIRRLEDFGAFVGIDNTFTSGLLHISNISRSHVDTIDKVFTTGDRVRCLVLGMDDDYSRISLSTAELEEEDGDMMRDKERVYANSEVQVEFFRRHMQGLQDGDGEEGEGEYMDGPAAEAGHREVEEHVEEHAE